MALFRKKPAEPEEKDSELDDLMADTGDLEMIPGGGIKETDDSDTDAFSGDLDDFANELELNAPSSSKNDLSAELEALNNPSKSGTVSEPDTLDLNQQFEVESRQAAAAGKIPAPAPFVPSSLKDTDFPEPETPFYDPQVALPPPPEKKKLPLVPIIGVAAVLLIGGGAALLMSRGGTEDETLAPDPSPTANIQVGNSTSLDPAVAPTTLTPVDPNRITIPAKAPTPELQAQLKALWEKGAAAKKKGDYAGARKAWEEALKLDPGHGGFPEAIAKLPKQ